MLKCLLVVCKRIIIFKYFKNIVNKKIGMDDFR